MTLKREERNKKKKTKIMLDIAWLFGYITKYIKEKTK
jgi:hypothetical protein